MFCSQRSFLEARVELDRARLQVLAPRAEPELIEMHLHHPLDLGGQDAGFVGGLRQRERFHWLAAPRSTIFQTSPPDLAAALGPVPRPWPGAAAPIRDAGSAAARKLAASTCGQAF